jgi:2-polyprenyl-6-methoxyphenol hydroxylase-like FAD-dependent oxidoreductase
VKIGVVGGGPAGLYFALLMKRQDPAHRIRVVEQNPAEATYGWGVVFSDRALSFLESADPESCREVARRLETWDDQAIVHRGQAVRIDGLGFSGIARLELLRVLQDRCRALGVELQFGTRLTDLTTLRDCDLIVGADGVNSLVRETHRAHFGPRVEELTNRYAWYGTARPFDCLTLTFREHGGGVFVAHHYRYGPAASTFIVECDADTWTATGLAGMSDDERRRACEAVFAAELGGHPLRAGRSPWQRFKVVTNARWSHDNVVLIGDALRSVHFSIGSGTRMALEDAIALAGVCGSAGDVTGALRAFEQARRPSVDALLGVAARSSVWYEHMREKLALEPVAFAYDYLTRGGTLSPERVRARFPRFAGLVEWGAPTWPPTPPQRSSRPGEAGSLLG